jgi:hypothetical protein
MDHTILSIVHLPTSPMWSYIQCHLEPPVHTNAHLDLSKPPVHLSTPLDLSKPPVQLELFNSIVYNLHFFAYRLAMQNLVSVFIQHPSTYPSRYIIITGWKVCIMGWKPMFPPIGLDPLYKVLVVFPKP